MVTLSIPKDLWRAIFQLIKREKARRIWLFGTKEPGMYRVLRISAAKGMSVRKEGAVRRQYLHPRTLMRLGRSQAFLGVFFNHPCKKWFFNKAETSIVQMLRCGGGQVVAGVIVDFEDRIALYPVLSGSDGDENIVFENEGFIYTPNHTAYVICPPQIN